MSTPALSWRLKPPRILNYAIADLTVAAAVAADLAFDKLFGVDPSVS